MKLVVLYGPPAVGKLTVGQQLSSLTGFRLFHNHLVVDTLLALFPFGSSPFVELRERHWLECFEEAARFGLPGVVFTFQPEASVRPGFFGQVSTRLQGLRSTVQFAALTASEETIEQRIINPSRREHLKLTDLPTYRSLRDAGAFEHEPMPADVTVDTGSLTPPGAAQRIVDALRLAD